MHPFQMSKMVVTGKRLSKDCMASNCHKNLSHRGEKVLANRLSPDPMNMMIPRYKFGMWLGMRSNSAECFVGNADGLFGAREIR